MMTVYVSAFDLFVFFFKQKTAYEIRISDWSSDVCSSDLLKVSSVPAKPAKKTATATRTRKLAATKAAASAAPKATAKPVTVARTRKPAAAKVAATSAPSDTPEKTFPAKN